MARSSVCSRWPCRVSSCDRRVASGTMSAAASLSSSSAALRNLPTFGTLNRIGEPSTVKASAVRKVRNVLTQLRCVFRLTCCRWPADIQNVLCQRRCREHTRAENTGQRRFVAVACTEKDAFCCCCAAGISAIATTAAATRATATVAAANKRRNETQNAIVAKRVGAEQEKAATMMRRVTATLAASSKHIASSSTAVIRASVAHSVPSRSLFVASRALRGGGAAAVRENETIIRVFFFYNIFVHSIFSPRAKASMASTAHTTRTTTTTFRRTPNTTTSSSRALQRCTRSWPSSSAPPFGFGFFGV